MNVYGRCWKNAHLVIVNKTKQVFELRLVWRYQHNCWYLSNNLAQNGESSICLPFSFITTQDWRPMLVTVCLLPVCTWLVSITTADEIELNGIFDKWDRIITYVIVFWYWLERNTFQMNYCHCVYSHSMLLLVLSLFLLHYLFSYSRYSLKGNST